MSTITTTARPTISGPAPSGGADVRDYLGIHAAITRATAALTTATADPAPLTAARAAALTRYWEGYTNELHHHHVVEDTIFFPALIERVPSVEEHLGRVDVEHHALDELFEIGHDAFGSMEQGGTPTAAHAVMRRLQRLMTDHLDFEDADLVPLFGRHFSQDEYRQLHEQAVPKGASLRDLSFMIPYMATWLDTRTWGDIYDPAPLPMKLVYRLTRRSHARLAKAALGYVPEPVAG